MFVDDQQDQDQIWGLISALGLDAVKSLSWEMHYRQQGCYDGFFVHTTGAPRGVRSDTTSSKEKAAASKMNESLRRTRKNPIADTGKPTHQMRDAARPPARISPTIAMNVPSWMY